MKCPECLKEGERSKVYRGEMSSTVMAGQEEYWDEDGRHHYHDPNSTTTGFWCSRGHRWQETRWRGCAACGKEDHVEVKILPRNDPIIRGAPLRFTGGGVLVIDPSAGVGAIHGKASQ